MQVTTWVSHAANSIGQAENLAKPFVVTADPFVLYAAIIERGAPTYASVADLNIKVGILPA